jgi:hypothetical protein
MLEAWRWISTDKMEGLESAFPAVQVSGAYAFKMSDYFERRATGCQDLF